jgi:hypothetical protein
VDGGGDVCALRCFRQNAIECPPGFVCADQDGAGERSICVAAPIDNETAPEVAESRPTGSSCSAGFGIKSATLPWWSVLLLMWLSAVRAGRRNQRPADQVRGDSFEDLLD